MKSLFIASLIATTTIAVAQNHDLKPVEGLTKLDFLTGDWSGTQNFTANGSTTVAKLTLHVHPAISGHYLEEHSITEITKGKPSDVRHFLTFDAKSGKYRAWWFNDTRVGPSEFEGTLNGNTFVLESKSPGPTLRATYELVSPKQLKYKLEMKNDTGWMELFHNSLSK